MISLGNNMKTKFDSHYINDLPEGCKRCVRGEKLVLFVTGKCSRNCYYCSLSHNRKNSDIVMANERECKSPKDAILECKESNAKGCGITGGDPLLFLDRTLEYAKALKSAFSDFHIHIYLPTTLINEKNIKQLSEVIDEFRIHPSFLQKDIGHIKEAMREDLEKIKLVKNIIGKERLGLEMPAFPEKVRDIVHFINGAKDFISFVNLNELEISETNFDIFTKEYAFNEDSYTISGSVSAGKKILDALRDSGLKMHLCTAVTKMAHQYGNRLKRTEALPFAERDKEGMADYFAIYCSNIEELNKDAEELEKKFGNDIFLDMDKLRIIISKKIVKKVIKSKKFKVSKVKEYPTSDRIEVEVYPLSI
jgi:pyruvate formate-lyase activating enzyme-like uncharacterized protein